MDSKDDELNKKKENLKTTISILLSMAIFILVVLLIVITDTFKTSALGDFGSFMNVIIAITSTLTVILVYYGVRIQSIEFQATNKKLQEQINRISKEETVNRTIKIISNWEELRNEGHILTDEQKKFIKKHAI